MKAQNSNSDNKLKKKVRSDASSSTYDSYNDTTNVILDSESSNDQILVNLGKTLNKLDNNTVLDSIDKTSSPNLDHTQKSSSNIFLETENGEDQMIDNLLISNQMSTEIENVIDELHNPDFNFDDFDNTDISSLSPRLESSKNQVITDSLFENQTSRNPTCSQSTVEPTEINDDEKRFPTLYQMLQNDFSITKYLKESHDPSTRVTNAVKENIMNVTNNEFSLNL